MNFDQKRVERHPHPGPSLKPAEPAFRRPPELFARGMLLHVKLQKRGGDVDQSLNETGRIGNGGMALPERLPDLMGLPKIKPVEEIDAVEVRFERPPLIGGPGGMNLGAEGAKGAVTFGVADRMRVKAGDEAIGRERAIFGVPGKGVKMGRIGNGGEVCFLHLQSIVPISMFLAV